MFLSVHLDFLDVVERKKSLEKYWIASIVAPNSLFCPFLNYTHFCVCVICSSIIQWMYPFNPLYPLLFKFSWVAHHCLSQAPLEQHFKQKNKRSAHTVMWFYFIFFLLLLDYESVFKEKDCPSIHFFFFIQPSFEFLNYRL